MNTAAFDDALLQIQMLYVDMPHLQLTTEQIHRVVEVREDLCDQVVMALVADGLLHRTCDGAFGLCVGTRRSWSSAAETEGASDAPHVTWRRYKPPPIVCHPVARP